MSEIKQIIKKGEKSEESSRIDPNENFKQNTKRNLNRLNDSAAQYLQAFAELQEGIEKIKSLISEPGILTEAPQQNQKSLTLTGPELDESKLKLQNILRKHQMQKEEVTQMTKEYEETFAKLKNMHSQLEVVDSEFQEKKASSLEPQGDLDEFREFNQTAESHKIQLDIPQNSTITESNPIGRELFQIYSEGFSQYLGWLSFMVSSYCQAIKDLNDITQAQMQIVNAEVSLKKNFENLWSIENPNKRNEKSPSPSEDYFTTFAQSVQNMTVLGTKCLESWHPFFTTDQKEKK